MSEIVDTEVLDTGFLQCRLPMSRAELLSAQRSTMDVLSHLSDNRAVPLLGGLG